MFLIFMFNYLGYFYHPIEIYFPNSINLFSFITQTMFQLNLLKNSRNKLKLHDYTTDIVTL